MKTIQFPEYSGVRCLMLPYIQGEALSVPSAYQAYADILNSVFLHKGDVGFLTIDESPVQCGAAHRGARAKWPRALHTEVGRHSTGYKWGGNWGGSSLVTVDADVRILLCNNLDDSCALWPTTHEETSNDGDIGYAADSYPYEAAVIMKACEVHEIGILTPHESLPVKRDFNRQFLRIVSSGVHGREPYFTPNPLVEAA